jgi:hypothetical protein
VLLLFILFCLCTSQFIQACATEAMATKNQKGTEATAPKNQKGTEATAPKKGTEAMAPKIQKKARPLPQPKVGAAKAAAAAAPAAAKPAARPLPQPKVRAAKAAAAPPAAAKPAAAAKAAPVEDEVGKILAAPFKPMQATSKAKAAAPHKAPPPEPAGMPPAKPGEAARPAVVAEPKSPAAATGINRPMTSGKNKQMSEEKQTRENVKPTTFETTHEWKDWLVRASMLSSPTSPKGHQQVFKPAPLSVMFAHLCFHPKTYQVSDARFCHGNMYLAPGRNCNRENKG